MINPLPTVLLTGFTPFDGDALNPSWQAVRALDGKRIARHRVVAVELPTEFGAALPALRRALRTVQPRLAIAFGLAGGRTGISLERVAINVIDARIPDNAGAQPIDVPVLRSGPAAYFSTLPIKAMLAAPAMPLAQMQQAAAIIVRVALTTAGDARRSGGAEA